MKKILYFVLTIMLLLPLTVKADEMFLISHYNSKPTVGGYLEISIPIPENIKQIKLTYDSTMLKPIDDLYSINDHIKSNGVITEKYVKNVSVKEGNLTIELDPTFWNNVLDEYGGDMKEIKVIFTSLKEGESLVNIDYMKDGINSLGVRYEAKSLTSTKFNEQKEEVKEETKEGVKEETKEGKKCDNLFLYISLGLNVLLLIVLLIIVLKKNTKKEVIGTQEEAK